ncbi:SEC-C metal-binding domain-containing protein [Lachnoclostridium sp. Marseille-P6806]|uniref:SEC-C metal-binding domain-containing protein n=1 Tax=Lachnoclostridium sp. Marseille-P6806 TaxID=2364793 RepID=UPI001030B525|nr:SEC-C metal-binding domain-containing protein [Lachnoclostridium sp. Marseille-P6806]
MGILQDWRNKAYNEKANKGDLQRLWADYFKKERDVYAELLKEPDTEVKGTVSGLAEKYGLSLEYMVGFLDGINDSLETENPIETMDENTEVSLAFNTEKLYKNMVAAGADWLYGLEEWNSIFPEEKRKELYLEQKKSGTVVKEKKVYPNDPCPCGSGKKYKKCHGKNA